MLLKEFSPDKGLRKEATEMQQQRQSNKEKEKASRKEEVMIETAKVNVSGPKVVGKIDLDRPAATTASSAQESKAEAPKATAEKTEPQAKAKDEAKVEKKQEPQPVSEVPVVVDSEQPAEKPEKSKKKSKPAIGDVAEDGVFRLTKENIVAPTLTVKGHIDLSSMNQSTRPKKKTKEEKRKEREEKHGKQKRVRIGQQRVDVESEARKSTATASSKGSSSNQQGNQGKKQNNQQQQQGQGKKKKKNQPKQTVLQTEVSDEEVAKQVRETLARLTSKDNKLGKGAKYRREKRDAIRHGMEEELEQQAAESKVLKLTEFVTANELATMMNVPVTKIIGTCMSIGIMVSINQRIVRI